MTGVQRVAAPGAPDRSARQAAIIETQAVQPVAEPDVAAQP